MILTLATGIGEAAALASWISAATAVAGTAVSLVQAQTQNARANRAEALARQKAAQDQLAANAKAAQDRSIIERRLAKQVDSARVVAGAAGVSGGASQMVLESQFAANARTDLATISANQQRGALGTSMSLNNTINRIDESTINPFAAGISGIAQGIGTFTTVNDGLNSLLKPTPEKLPPPIGFSGPNTSPTTSTNSPAGVIV